MNNQKSGSTALVLTTINSPNDALNLLADGCRDHAPGNAGSCGKPGI